MGYSARSVLDYPQTIMCPPRSKLHCTCSGHAQLRLGKIAVTLNAHTPNKNSIAPLVLVSLAGSMKTVLSVCPKGDGPPGSTPDYLRLVTLSSN